MLTSHPPAHFTEQETESFNHSSNPPQSSALASSASAGTSLSLSQQQAHKPICDHLPLEGISQTPPRLGALPLKPCSSLAGGSCCWLGSLPSPTRPRPPELEPVLACTCHIWAWGSSVIGSRYKRGAFFLRVLGDAGVCDSCALVGRRLQAVGAKGRAEFLAQERFITLQAGWLHARWGFRGGTLPVVIGGWAQMPFRRDGITEGFVPLAVPVRCRTHVAAELNLFAHVSTSHEGKEHRGHATLLISDLQGSRRNYLAGEGLRWGLHADGAGSPVSGEGLAP